MNSPINIAVLMLGGNIGDTSALFERALYQLEKLVGNVELRSSLFSSSPWGNHSQPDFLNQALVLQTSLSPIELLKSTVRIESDLGKNKIEPNGPRTIDIDILFYNDVVLNTPELILPHPRLHLRRFNLLPLNDIIPDKIHPLLNEKISTLLSTCTDSLSVNRITTGV